MQSEILDSGFNVAVNHIASRVLPCGFDISSDAPGDYESLIKHYEKTGRVCVWDGASDQTIFGCPETNYAFRAWHDARHITARADFSLEGEVETCKAQCRDIYSLFGDGSTAIRYSRYLWAEIVGQAKYNLINGGFPVDQIGFVRAWLDNARTTFETHLDIYQGAPFGISN